MIWRGGRAPIMPFIDFDKETIGHILKDRTTLRVPINQRSYAWKEEHVKDLYTDLDGAIRDHAEEYFLGAVIVVAPKDGSLLEVYDGQQRIATSMILIAAIRDFFFNARDNEIANNIARESLYSPERKTNNPKPHFTLSAEDHESFVKRILLSPDDDDRKSAKPDPRKESHTRIDSAARIAADHVEKITQTLHDSD